jgi:hypothetical protein
MDAIGSDSARRDAGTEATSTSALASAPRRQVILGAAAFLGLALTAGCTAPGTRRCNEVVGSGQHSHRMKMVPCPPQEPAS